MKRINRKKLNNKGFTLIELLAVVVILAVVMGIATNSVLSSMNKSRGGSLSDSTAVIVNAFNTKYTETLVDSVPTAVYGGVNNFKGYDFTVDSAYAFDSSLADEFGISGTAYSLGTVTFDSDDKSVSIKTGTSVDVTSSFIAYDADNGKFLVCMAANNTGNVYVAGYAIGGANAAKDASDNYINSTTFDGTTYKFADKTMFSCSDGTKSWQ